MLIHFQIETAVEVLKRHGVIAYPTEAVFGLGCDPFCEDAVKKILSLKKRDVHKGVILIAHSFELFREWVQPLSDKRFNRVMSSWPGPITWLFPAEKWVPEWIRGNHHTVAIRVTAHPLVRHITELYEKPLVSTSANPEGLKPAVTVEEVKYYFDEKLDYILHGEIGGLTSPTEIRDAMTGTIVRKA